MSEGLGFQVDGKHYTDMKMQPVELAYRLYGTPCFCKLAKYLTREKGDKLVNLQKALHCIKLEKDLKEYASSYLNIASDYNTITEAGNLINVFTNIFRYRLALFHMWLGDYDVAIYWVEQCITEFE